MNTHRAPAGEWQPGGRSQRSGDGSATTAASEPAIRVVVVDEHDVIRAGIRALIASEPGVVVVGEARNGAQAIDLVHTEDPDVVLMDVRLRVVDGIEATRRMRSLGVRAAIVLISTECDAETLMAGLRAGARGYVLKDVDREELLSVIRRVLTGSHAIESTLATEVLRQMAEEVERQPSLAPEPLTPREMEVLRLITMGGTNRQIASRLFVAVGTVKVHVEHIMAKLGAVDRTQAAVRAIEMGIITNVDGPESEARTT